MENYTKEQIEEFRETFDTFDEDKDGTICIKELGKMMRMFQQNVSDKELKAIMDSADADGNGRIEFEEFVTIMANCGTEEDDIEDALRIAFQQFDADGSGTITADELKRVIQQCGEDITDPEIDDIIREMDLDGDGQIDYTEFAKVMLEKRK